jgi:Rrf2 family protein
VGTDGGAGLEDRPQHFERGKKGLTMLNGKSLIYGVVCVVEIARHDQAHDGAIKACAISARYKMPTHYIAKILRALVQAGVITGKRGTMGGYQLAKPAELTSLHDIYQALQQKARQQVVSPQVPSSIVKKLRFAEELVVNNAALTFQNIRLPDLMLEAVA